ncbi:oligosaccharide flippase family protein, partial [Providencia rettgeri]|uniref:oligosaccharide flippase family protein n=2 Tax=Providencia TaxID=586 RepID=UPI001EFCC177
MKSIFLFIIRDFIFILCLQVVIKILENFLVNNKINKLYATVFSSDVIPLNNTEKETIKRKTIATFYHKLGTVFVNSTDSIIISAFVGVSILGVYSNYTMVITLLTTFISVAFNSTIASFGNLIIEKKDKSEESFYIIQYTSIFIFGLASLLFLTQINSVISLWIGDKYN